MPGRPAPLTAISQARKLTCRAPILSDATIVFDLDGTLADTAPDLTNALNEALPRRGHNAIPQETIRSAVGFGARVMIEEALRRAGAAEDIDEMLAEFLAHYEANIAAESRPFPGAVASLEMLAKAGQGSRCARTSANISRASCSRRLAFNIIFTALRATTRSPCRSRTRPRHPCDRVCRR